MYVCVVILIIPILTRTDDIVDSPRALLNQDVLQEDLSVWNDRLDRIWDGDPEGRCIYR